MQNRYSPVRIWVAPPNTMYPHVTLKPEKDLTLNFHHPWIFSGALESKPTNLANGELIYVKNSRDEIVATGTYSAKSMIAVRIFEFGKTEIDEDWITTKIDQAHKKRLLLGYGPDSETTAYRVVFSEADSLPGLIVDRYEDTFVLQFSTIGMSQLKKSVIQTIIKLFNPQAIVERSEYNAHESSLGEITEILYGKIKDKTTFKENGIKLATDVLKGQKTGYFLDQKVLRQSLQKYAKNHKVLNLFSYTGASSINAIKAGAKSVHNIDASDFALELAQENAKLNKISSKKFTTETADIFKWLAEKTSVISESYDMVILDPPALIKSRNDLKQGLKAYHFINRAALRLIKNNGIFVTSSCSHYFTEEDFVRTLRRASLQSGINLTVLETIHQSPDHPISIYFPESAYLKSFICLAEKI